MGLIGWSPLGNAAPGTMVRNCTPQNLEMPGLGLGMTPE